MLDNNNVLGQELEGPAAAIMLMKEENAFRAEFEPNRFSSCRKMQTIQ